MFEILRRKIVRGRRWTSIFSHADIFVWVDLRRYLYEEPVQGAAPIDTESIDTEPVSSMVDIYRERETKLFKRYLASGIGVSLGSSFATEELG